MDYLPDEIVYRCISEACADLKESDRLFNGFLFLLLLSDLFHFSD
jgi:hypothetical protein